MTQPIWITPAGSLGTIPEGRFYQLPLRATNATFPDDVKFKLISGRLPAGIQVRLDGTVEGIPEVTAITQGVPLLVSENVTSKFTVRAYTEVDVNGSAVVLGIADRTFTLTITGQDIPVFTTPAGNLGYFLDATEISIPIEFTDEDPDDEIIIRLVSGELPPGLTLSADGVISGIVRPVTGLPGTATPGLDLNLFDLFPFDFTTIAINKNFEFTVEITDGKDSALRTFSIFVYSRNNIPAVSGDDAALLALVENPPSDITKERPPFILNEGPSIGTVRHDNYFAYQFRGIDFDGDQIEYEVINQTALPPAMNTTSGKLTLDPVTGWLYGYIPNLGAVEESYTFNIIAKKRDLPHITSKIYAFTLNIKGNIEAEVQWLSPTFLGTMLSGEPSVFQIEAATTLGTTLRYRIVSGSKSRLPQGLRLTDDGLLIGRPSFNVLKFDGGTTTFDAELGTRLVVAPTTFDTVYTFSVNAYASDGSVSVFKTFTLRLDAYTREPWETVYIQATPPEDDRTLITQITQDRNVFSPELIYRNSDPRFGIASKVTYVHLFGVKSAPLQKHLEAAERNHYRKKLVLGEVKTAQALDDAGNVIYEVVYSEIQDDIALINERVNLMPQMLNRPVVDGWPVTVVFPNSLNNMRRRVFDTVGQAYPALPLWMRSKQANGRVLGFTPAWVMAYVRPGASQLVKYRLDQKYSASLNTIDFEVDRYIVDREQTSNWDATAGEWAPFSFTTFDRDTVETTFDQGSMRFVSPVDYYGFGDRFDKYVVFPNRGILK